jgi:hypothetical protein
VANNKSSIKKASKITQTIDRFLPFFKISYIVNIQKRARFEIKREIPNEMCVYLTFFV